MANGLHARVTYVEAQLDGHAERMNGIQETLSGMDARIDRRFEAVDRRFESIDRRFEAMDRRFDALDDKMSRQFLWMIGIQVTTLLTVLGAVVTAVLTR